MTHEKMINCWKLYLAAFAATRADGEFAPTEEFAKTNAEEVFALARGVHEGSMSQIPPLDFRSFETLMLKETDGIGIGTVG